MGNLHYNDMSGKAEKYYIPILEALIDELKRIASENVGIPEKLIPIRLLQMIKIEQHVLRLLILLAY